MRVINNHRHQITIATGTTTFTMTMTLISTCGRGRGRCPGHLSQHLGGSSPPHPLSKQFRHRARLARGDAAVVTGAPGHLSQPRRY